MMFVYFQDLGEIANSEVQTLMKNRIDWRSQSVENWLRHNFEERDSGDNVKTEKISKTRQMDKFHKASTDHCSEKDISKYQHHPPPGRDKLSGNPYNQSLKNSFILKSLFNLNLFL